MGSLMSSPEPPAEVKQFVDQEIQNNKVVVFSKSWCNYCKTAKTALQEVGADFKAIEIDERVDGSQIQEYLGIVTGATTVPRVFINGKCIGGGSETKSLQKSGKLTELINEGS